MFVVFGQLRKQLLHTLIVLNASDFARNTNFSSTTGTDFMFPQLNYIAVVLFALATLEGQIDFNFLSLTLMTLLDFGI